MVDRIILLVLVIFVIAAMGAASSYTHKGASYDPSSAWYRADYDNAIPDPTPWTWYDAENANDICNIDTVEKLHPVALKFLYVWWRGLIDDQQFMQVFGLVNSDYIAAAECMVRMKNQPRYWKPQA